jgi:hypothetical protein
MAVLGLRRLKIQRIDGHHLDRESGRRRHEDDRPNPMVGHKGQSLDELLVSHHPIVARRQGAIDPLQAERPMEQDRFVGRSHRHEGVLLQNGGRERNGVQSAKSVRPPDLIRAAHHMRFHGLGRIGRDLGR